jgi:hypothetical protein
MNQLNHWKNGARGLIVMLVVAVCSPNLYAAVTNALPGDDREFEVAAMPAELAKDADVVVRLDALIFTVESPKRAIEHVRRAVTILNQNGRELGKVVVFYDRFRQIKSLRGLLRDAQGKKIRELKKSDVKDYSAITDFSLYDDHRVQVAELYHDLYPYTVVFEYEIIRDGVINWPAWYPQELAAPVEQTSFELSVPAEMPVRYRLRGMSDEPQIQQLGNRKVLRWEAARLPEREPEPYGPSWSEQAPSVLTAPAAFEIAGYSGDMSSWVSFGRWFHQLTEGRTLLPAPALTEVQQLCETAKTSREKAQRLYELLQSKTRYVSVQLGIGGWQPFDPAYVFTRGYGDCKALSNYMIAMLRAAEVEAYPVLIRHGTDAPEVLADFSSNQFNHMMACLPMNGDTLWLECTSQTVPFGHIGAGNEDRNVLVVTSEGGKLVRTPRSKSTDNQQVRHATVILSETGNARAEVRTKYTGNQQDRVRNALAQSSPRDRENWLREEIDVPSFQLTNVDFSAVDKKQAEIDLPVTLELPRFASRSGTRLFLRPNLMERRKYVPPEVKERTQPVDLTYAFLDVDTVIYRLPVSFSVEAAPPPVTLETTFGSYHASVVIRDGVLEYVRRLEIRESRLPAEQYDAYRKFVAEMVKADNVQVVLVRKT